MSSNRAARRGGVAAVTGTSSPAHATAAGVIAVTRNAEVDTDAGLTRLLKLRGLHEVSAALSPLTLGVDTFGRADGAPELHPRTAKDGVSSGHGRALRTLPAIFVYPIGPRATVGDVMLLHLVVGACLIVLLFKRSSFRHQLRPSSTIIIGGGSRIRSEGLADTLEQQMPNQHRHPSRWRSTRQRAAGTDSRLKGELSVL